jgi:competence protein ComEC
MIATHPHDDHIGGLAAVLNAVPVDVIYSPVTNWNSKAWDSLFKYASAQGTLIVIPQEGDSFLLGSATVTILHYWPEAWAENDMSIVLRVDYGSTSFLFTGDAEEMSEYMMLTDQVPLAASVLKVGHHGSRYSSSPEFIEAVAPSWAVISCGEGNPYGHPHDETLRALAGVKMLRTDQLGTIVFHSDGQTLTVSTADEPDVEAAYIGNRNSMKFHSPDCPSVAEMAEHNKVPLASRQDASALGYKPCGSCKP